ncbi:hypothetical protein GCM10025780_34000 [Frondihabitans cladoniiphilus]|uniref:Excreted virulence factor EspC (Type VII ESX diderm) n=1 Tax=Frondihabitans cladoniiphilus TaxID=715785 RepID=A0ABP8WCJ8_9MICO
MSEYRVDPEALHGVASMVSSSADSGPPGRLPEVDDCGSGAVASACDESGIAFASNWSAALEEATGLGVAAALAAQQYREAEARVERSARSAQAPHSSGSSGGGGR